MKLDSDVNLAETKNIYLSPIYEEKAISILIRALIRFVDIIGALIGIFMLIPITLYVLIEKIVNDRKGPLFYYQERIGKDGKTFKMFKLNTKSIMSEFPEFINVLFGTMTLVGPRPYTTGQKELMGSYFDIISKVKPGVTGIYQISGRSIEFEERLDLDLHYILNRSLKLDLKILLITLFVTVKNKKSRYYEKLVYAEIPKETLSSYVVKNISLFIKRLVDIIISIVRISFINTFNNYSIYPEIDYAKIKDQYSIRKNV